MFAPALLGIATLCHAVQPDLWYPRPARLFSHHRTVRKETVVNFQLWNTNDYDHRLHPEKLLNIIELSEKTLGIEDLEIEVVYQGETIGKFGLDFDGTNFLLTTKQTDCLAPDQCGVPVEKPKLQFSDIQTGQSCKPGSGCC